MALALKRPALHMRMRCLLAPLLLALPLASAQSLAEEDAAFARARALTEPGPRVAALQAYGQKYPHGARTVIARRLLLATLLASFPDRTGQIHEEATAELADATLPLERWSMEARLALQLAEAGDRGADLADARTWAADAVHAMTERAYQHELTLTAARFHLPALSPAQTRSQFRTDRSSALAALAAVHLRLGQTAQAAPLLREALSLQPLSADANRLDAERLASDAPPPLTLRALIRANALGPLPSTDQKLELELFQQLEHGDAAALAARVDQTYLQLFPIPFILPRRAPLTGGHPALLELFTGSDCLPCTGADLAVDSLLHTYGPTDLIALSFDEHIPLPDPLATSQTVERAATYVVGSTPTAFLDGRPLQIPGSTRGDVENIVLTVADRVEEEAVLPGGLALKLHATVSGDELKAEVRLRISTPPQTASKEVTTGEVSLHLLQRMELHIALAQDEMRYSGRNGVRLHRMVVRALVTLPAANALTGPAAVSFDLSRLEAEQAAYLENFETSNPEFGSMHFRQTHFPVDPGHLHLVAWVQDPLTRHILQTTQVPVVTPSDAPTVPQ